MLFQPTKEMSFCRPVINRGISHIPSQPLTSLLVFYYIGTTADAKAEKIHYSAKESHSAHHSNGRKELSIFPVNPDAAGATVFLHQFVFFIVLNVSSFNPCTFVCVAAQWALNCGSEDVGSNISINTDALKTKMQMLLDLLSISSISIYALDSSISTLIFSFQCRGSAALSEMQIFG